MIYYRSCNTFAVVKLLQDVRKSNIKLTEDHSNQYHNHITYRFSKIVKEDVFLKKKIARCNQSAFMNKEFQKQVYTIRGLQSKYSCLFVSLKLCCKFIKLFLANIMVPLSLIKPKTKRSRNETDNCKAFNTYCINVFTKGSGIQPGNLSKNPSKCLSDK